MSRINSFIVSADKKGYVIGAPNIEPKILKGSTKLAKPSKKDHSRPRSEDRMAAARLRGEESPGFMRKRRRLMAGQGDLTDSAEET